ncbi:Alg9-like mannosyltransferase family-domain-containing protein [Xylaria bambusicola]|uniref:Alg9-like mannosyltransferase family-domain-containing protein n=1 Tax=Xylaria bambusicola TaxID=326684 RepID=UPI00200797C9|nr:Alg9-like mannosyltransferase family-domain-containing protein [Xylaria bambusicola]KAI0505101.1 Alg9-like mannosyltransferase family-domain-containing protein [Xylaria bambusicola]
MGGVIDILLSLSIPTLVIIHMVVAPYTKVEESFNIQATHDILAYGTPTKNVYQHLSSHYDHFDFPGAVPRTFLGPVFLAGMSQPLISLVGFHHAQLVVRALLGLINSAALLTFKHNLGRAFGRSTARWYTVLQACQFHILFYASRPLPNMFAFPLTTLAFSYLIPHPDPRKQGVRYKVAIALLTLATAIFRSELAILMVTVTVYGLISPPRISLPQITAPFLGFFAVALLVSVPIDSYFWQKPLWPELWGFYYNAVLGSSSEWGVSPLHYYFTSALPKILTSSLVLLPFALWNPGTAKQARALAVPSLLFVAIYSIQPHKEARFIFYVAPPLTAAAALGAGYVFSRRTKSPFFATVSLAILGSVLVSFAISTVMLGISSLNYPGGEALAAFKDLVASTKDLDIQTAAVHTDVLSCMTGVTLFGQHSNWPLVDNTYKDNTISFTFDKTEDEMTLRNPVFWEKFDYVLAEDPAKPLGPWEVIGVVEGFAGIEILKPGSFATGNADVESAGDRVLGRGTLVKRVRDMVRKTTGGWWIGPRMEPRIHILRKVRGGEARKAVTS